MDIVKSLNLEFIQSDLIPLREVLSMPNATGISPNVIDIAILRHAEWVGTPGHHVYTDKGIAYANEIQDLYENSKLIVPDIIYTFKHPQFSDLANSISQITRTKRMRRLKNSMYDPNHRALEMFVNDVRHGHRKFLFIWRHSQIKSLALEFGCNTPICNTPWKGYKTLLHLQFELKPNKYPDVLYC